MRGEGIRFQDIELLEEIGEGAFAKVYRAIWKGEYVAVKKLVLPSVSDFFLFCFVFFFFFHSFFTRWLRWKMILKMGIHQKRKEMIKCSLFLMNFEEKFPCLAPCNTPELLI